MNEEDEITVEDLIANRPGFEEVHPATRSDAIAITDSIYMSQGMSNAYMIVTEAGRIIVNTGMAFEGGFHRVAFDNVYSGPTRFICLTQGHVDHLGGVKDFREEEGTQLIAQENNFLCQQDDKRIQKIRSDQAYIWFKPVIDQAINVARTNPEAFQPQEVVPDITFRDSYEFSLGGVEFQMLATPGGETIDSAILWLPEEKILFSGNLFGPLFPHFPNINTLRGDKYRFLEPYLESLRLVKALAPEVLITGHFDPIRGAGLIQQCLDRLEKAVTYVHDQTLKGMNAGESVWSLMERIKLPESILVGEGYGQVSWAVRTLWESYMGWFKAQKTSELYALQPESIYQELLRASDNSELFSIIQSSLEIGENKNALLLSEACLEVCEGDDASLSDKQRALQLHRAVHIALLEEHRNANFWEQGWLKNMVSQIDQKLSLLNRSE